MKLRNLLFALTACAGLFTACSNEMEDAIDNGSDNLENAEAYAAISFAMPNAAATRANDTQVGSDDENQITTVSIVLFDQDGKGTKYTRSRTDFTPETTDASTVYSLKSTSFLSIASAGTYKVHVIVNPTTKLTDADIATLAAYNKYVEIVPQKTGAYCDKNTFMMTNANAVETIDITTKNTKTNPAVVTVPVERLAAKVTMDNSGNAVAWMDGANKVADIKFDAYKVVNTRNSAFGLRRVGAATDFNADFTKGTWTIGGAEADNYVIENMFGSKKTYNSTIYDENYSRKLTKYVAFRTLENTGIQTLAYCLENTLEARQDQNKAYTTGIILRGQVTFVPGKLQGQLSADKSFYRYNNVFYGNWTTLKAVSSIFTDKDDIKADKVELSKLGVEYFAQGYCYYYYWFTHRPGTVKDQVEKMENVTVRNNVYTLKITSVSSLGSFESGTPGPADPQKPEEDQDDVTNGGSNPEIPGTVAPNPEPKDPAIPVDPKDPIIDNDMYLKVTINVNPWTVRKNNIDL